MIDLSAMMRNIEDLEFVKAQGIRNIVTLIERPVEPEHLEAVDMVSLHIPVEDTWAPSVEQLWEFVEHVDECLDAGAPVAVLCLAGIGSRGAFLVSYLVQTQIRRLLKSGRSLPSRSRMRNRNKRFTNSKGENNE